jgi:hypothetical protein
MLYGGNSYDVPKDDAPRIVDVMSNPGIGKVLEVGIGRPRYLWVLYPWEGNDVLCRGAVLPYFELASSARLDDAAWRKLLDSSRRPDQPGWLAGLVSPGGTQARQKSEE